jgi:hypothetical protein
MEDSRLEIAFNLLNTKDHEDCSVVGYRSRPRDLLSVDVCPLKTGT